MTNRERLANVAEFDSPRWNAVLAEIQAELGVTDGDFAGVWWSGRVDEWEFAGTPERRLIIVDAYIANQIDWQGEIVS